MSVRKLTVEFQERITTDKGVYEPRDPMQMTFHGFHNTAVAPMMVDKAALLLGSHGTITYQTVNVRQYNVQFKKCIHVGINQH